jgi:hypothetical protein
MTERLSESRSTGTIKRPWSARSKQKRPVSSLGARLPEIPNERVKLGLGRVGKSYDVVDKPFSEWVNSHFAGDSFVQEVLQLNLEQGTVVATETDMEKLIKLQTMLKGTLKHNADRKLRASIACACFNHLCSMHKGVQHTVLNQIREALFAAIYVSDDLDNIMAGSVSQLSQPQLAPATVHTYAGNTMWLDQFKPENVANQAQWLSSYQRLQLCRSVLPAMAKEDILRVMKAVVKQLFGHITKTNGLWASSDGERGDKTDAFVAKDVMPSADFGRMIGLLSTGLTTYTDKESVLRILFSSVNCPDHDLIRAVSYCMQALQHQSVNGMVGLSNAKVSLASAVCAAMDDSQRTQVLTEMVAGLGGYEPEEEEVPVGVVDSDVEDDEQDNCVGGADGFNGDGEGGGGGGADADADAGNRGTQNQLMAKINAAKDKEAEKLRRRDAAIASSKHMLSTLMKTLDLSRHPEVLQAIIESLADMGDEVISDMGDEVIWVTSGDGRRGSAVARERGSVARERGARRLLEVLLPLTSPSDSCPMLVEELQRLPKELTVNLRQMGDCVFTKMAAAEQADFLISHSEHGGLHSGVEEAMRVKLIANSVAKLPTATERCAAITHILSDAASGVGEHSLLRQELIDGVGSKLEELASIVGCTTPGQLKGLVRAERETAANKAEAKARDKYMKQNRTRKKRHDVEMVAMQEELRRCQLQLAESMQAQVDTNQALYKMAAALQSGDDDNSLDEADEAVAADEAAPVADGPAALSNDTLPTDSIEAVMKLSRSGRKTLRLMKAEMTDDERAVLSQDQRGVAELAKESQRQRTFGLQTTMEAAGDDDDYDYDDDDDGDEEGELKEYAESKGGEGDSDGDDAPPQGERKVVSPLLQSGKSEYVALDKRGPKHQRMKSDMVRYTAEEDNGVVVADRKRRGSLAKHRQTNAMPWLNQLLGDLDHHGIDSRRGSLVMKHIMQTRDGKLGKGTGGPAQKSASRHTIHTLTPAPGASPLASRRSPLGARRTINHKRQTVTLRKGHSSAPRESGSTLRQLTAKGAGLIANANASQEQQKRSQSLRTLHECMSLFEQRSEAFFETRAAGDARKNGGAVGRGGLADGGRRDARRERALLRQPMDEFVFEAYLRQFSRASTAQEKMAEFLSSVQSEVCVLILASEACAANLTFFSSRLFSSLPVPSRFAVAWLGLCCVCHRQQLDFSPLIELFFGWITRDQSIHLLEFLLRCIHLIQKELIAHPLFPTTMDPGT